MGALWFKVRTTLDTKLIRQILNLVHITSFQHLSVYVESNWDKKHSYIDFESPNFFKFIFLPIHWRPLSLRGFVLHSFTCIQRWSPVSLHPVWSCLFNLAAVKCLQLSLLQASLESCRCSLDPPSILVFAVCTARKSSKAGLKLNKRTDPAQAHQPLLIMYKALLWSSTDSTLSEEHNTLTQKYNSAQSYIPAKHKQHNGAVWKICLGFYGIFYPLYLFSLPETIGSLKQLEQDVQDAM